MDKAMVLGHYPALNFSKMLTKWVSMGAFAISWTYKNSADCLPAAIHAKQVQLHI